MCLRGISAARGAAAGLAVFTTLTGCWLTSSFSGLGKGASEGGIADASDALQEEGPPADGGDDGGPRNLLDNPGFAGNTAGCGVGWMANLGTIQRSSVSKTGGSSCELCPNSTAPGGFSFGAPAHPGVWMSADADSASPTWTSIGG